MKLHYEGSETIRVAKDEVRRFLLDPEQVGRCLPDLHELTASDATHFVATVRVGVGPVRGLFKLDVTLHTEGEDDLRISLRGSGMGSGLQVESQVHLEALAQGTRLDWQADATVSGPLASVGGRLLEGQAKKTIEQLFASIRQTLEAVGV